MASTPAFVATARNVIKKLENSSGTTLYTLFTMGGAGGVLDGLFISSSDPTSRLIDVYVTDGSTDGIVDTIAIPAAISGRLVQQWNILDANRWTWLDPNSPRWTMTSGIGIKIQMQTSVTSTYQTNVVANYGEF